MADTVQNQSSSDDGNDVLTDSESEMSRSTTSKTTNKTLPEAHAILGLVGVRYQKQCGQ